jgi:hypothetical protein
LDFLLLEECIDTFMKLGNEYGTSVLLDVFDDQTTPALILELATALLGIHFGAENYKDVWKIRDYFGKDEETERIQSAIHPAKPPFTKLQKSILEHFIAKDEFWNIETNLFKVFDLPNTKDGLLSLMAINSSEVE